MKTILVCACFTLALISCKKDKDKDKEPVCQLSSVVDTLDHQLIAFEYGADGNIKRIDNYDTSGKIIYYTLFEYSANTVTKEVVNSGMKEKYVYHLNDKGYAEKVIRFMGSYGDTSLFEYDTEGLLTRSTGINLYNYLGDTLIYKNENGKRAVVYSSKDTVSRITFEYYDFEAKLKVLALINSNLYGDQVDKQFFLGKQMGALKSRYVYFKSDPAHTQVYDYTYELDTKGNISAINLVIRYKDSYVLFRERILLRYTCK